MSIVPRFCRSDTPASVRARRAWTEESRSSAYVTGMGNNRANRSPAARTRAACGPSEPSIERGSPMTISSAS